MGQFCSGQHEVRSTSEFWADVAEMRRQGRTRSECDGVGFGTMAFAGSPAKLC